ncbi:exported hypothetical protein [Candidatus Sulfopaludibacter sp. SbA4]|nr:exported hypothetical protein [Candidatus Sulfopaludibacter sp. SbA4]
MKKLQIKIVVASVFVALALVGTLMNSRQAIAQGPLDGVPVRIVQPVPVPVTGTVGVTGSTTVSGTVAATQSGAWNVAINGIPTVNLAPGANVGVTGNTEANPLWIRASDNPARSPFTLFGQVGTLGSVQFAGTIFPMGAPPSGQRYVIEHYNVTCYVAAGNTLTDVFVSLAAPVSAVTNAADDVVPHLTGSSPSLGTWIGGGNVRLYADPGQAISIGASASPGGLEQCSGSVSGYAVSLP